MSNAAALANLTAVANKTGFRPQVGFIAAHSGAEVREFVKGAVKVSIAFKNDVAVEALRVVRDTPSGLGNFRETEAPLDWAISWMAQAV